MQVLGAGQLGRCLKVKGVYGQKIELGDIFSIVGVYRVNPITLETTAVSMQFIALRECNLALNGEGVIEIWPHIIGPESQFQNVSELPVNGAEILPLFHATP